MPTRSLSIALVVGALLIAMAGIGVGVFRRDLLWPATQAPASARVRVNEATVCVAWQQPGGSRLVASVTPLSGGCYSSSCTSRYEQRADVWVSPLTYDLHFNSRFAFDHQYSPDRPFANKAGWLFVCTRDCEGAGRASIELPPLASGRYDVWLGTAHLGVVEVPEMGMTSAQACLSSETMDRPAPPPPTAEAEEQAPYPAIATVTALPTLPGYPNLP